MKNKYESIIIINPNIEDDKIKELIEYFKKLITDNQGTITRVEELGKKKLAYEIKKCNEGYYVALYFESGASVISELERLYRIKDEVIKYMTIRTDDE